MIIHSLSACAGCGVSGDDFASANVEAFEVTGELYCDDCADSAIQEAAGDGFVDELDNWVFRPDLDPAA
jgi:hypothetical protein